ncbi:MAG: DMT family transporter [Alphaproteobacteria bacterium]|nr:DMT family transporter [Alphaproteobacteria bacterium]
MIRWLDTHQPALLSLIMLIVLATMYSLGFLSASLATLDVGPVSAGGFRVILASLFLLIVLRVAGIGLVRGKVMWGYAAIYGTVCMAVPFTVLPWTLTYLSNATAAIYYAVIPIEVLVLSWMFLGSPVSARKWAGFAIASGGLIFLVLSGAKGAADTMAAPELRPDSDMPLWVPHVVCIMTAICIAVGGVLFQKMPKASPVAITASALLIGNLVAVPAVLWSPPPAVPSPEGIFWVLVSGIVATGCGMILRGMLIRRESAIYTSTIGYVVPIITAIIGFIALGESVGPVAILSYLLVLGGLLLSRA